MLLTIVHLKLPWVRRRITPLPQVMVRRQGHHTHQSNRNRLQLISKLFPIGDLQHSRLWVHTHRQNFIDRLEENASSMGSDEPSPKRLRTADGRQSSNRNPNIHSQFDPRAQREPVIMKCTQPDLQYRSCSEMMAPQPPLPASLEFADETYYPTDDVVIELYFLRYKGPRVFWNADILYVKDLFETYAKMVHYP